MTQIFSFRWYGFFLTVFLSLSTATYAQTTIVGTVKDSMLQEPLPFASVLLENEEGYHQGAGADSLGRFTFTNVPSGTYRFSAFYVGYPRFEKSITVTGVSDHTISLGAVYLQGTTTLDEVHVVALKDLIDQRPDGIVYHADKDPSNVGTTAEELLRKVPMVTVDMEGNVQMRGNGNVKVLIDGKPSTIIAASVKDALKQIPSDNIKSVEVITSPGAKYDAEGTAGVINIITKKSIIKGISGSVYSGLKYRIKQKEINGHAGINLNYRNNKFGLRAYFGGGRWSNLSDGSSIRTNFPGTAKESQLGQTRRNEGSGSFYWAGLSGDYTFDSLNSVQLGVNIHPGNWKTNMNQRTRLPSSGVDYNRSIAMESPRMEYSVNASYNHKSKRDPKRTLDLLALYSDNKTNSKYNLIQEDQATEVKDYKEKNNNDAVNKEFAVQMDYVHPLKKHHQKIETGLKYINRNVGSDYEFYNWKLGNGSEFMLDPTRSNQLNYIQQVAAAYAQFSTNLGADLSAVAGLRYEYTGINGSLRDNGGSFSSSFNNLLPSAILSWKLKHFNTLKLSYNQRIQRPSIEYINPYIDYSDPYNIRQGNPRLEPELTHNIELGYNTLLGGKTSLNFATFYRLTNNAIEATSIVGDNGVSRTTYHNIAKNKTIGLNVFAATSLFSKWRINLNGNIYYKNLYSPSLDIRNDGFEYDVHLFTSFKLSDKWSLNGFGMYRGNQVMLQGKSDGFYYYKIGVSREILKGKGKIGFSAENFLTPSITMASDYTLQNAVYHTESNSYWRGFQIHFNYRFGKMKFSAPVKTIENNDLKKSSDSQQGMGTPMNGS